MIKVLLIIAIFTCCVVAGVIIKNGLLNRVKCFEQFEILLNEISSKICFLKADKSSILKDFSNDYIYAKEFVSGYLTEGKGYLNILNDNENYVINTFLNSVGKSDMDGEISNLKYYEHLIDSMKSKSKDNYNKYGMFSVKMSIILGTLIAIILI